MDTLWLGLLVSTRWIAVFVAAPIFSHKSVPLRVRTALALLAAVACLPGVASAGPPPTESLAVAAALGGEGLTGVPLGFALRLIFAGFGLVGEFMAVQGGLGAATVLDPASGTSSVVLTSLLQFYALAVFLAVEGHHAIVRAAARSFQVLAPGGALLPADSFAAVSAFGGTLFEVGVRLAAPVTAVMLVSNVVVGSLGRVIPQLNLMALQLPAHIGVTLLVLALGTNTFSGAVAETLTSLSEGAVAAVLGDG